VRVKSDQDDLLYREILKTAMRRNRNAVEEEKAERERWRDNVRAVMLRGIRQEAGIVDDDHTLQGFVCACEGHNHAIAKTMAEYAALNAKDVVDRCARAGGLGEEDDEPLDNDELRDWESERDRSRYQAPAKRRPVSGLAALIAPAKKAR
jgi:hypothetical protein